MHLRKWVYKVHRKRKLNRSKTFLIVKNYNLNKYICNMVDRDVILHICNTFKNKPGIGSLNYSTHFLAYAYFMFAHIDLKFPLPLNFAWNINGVIKQASSV